MVTLIKYIQYKKDILHGLTLFRLFFFWSRDRGKAPLHPPPPSPHEAPSKPFMIRPPRLHKVIPIARDKSQVTQAHYDIILLSYLIIHRATIMRRYFLENYPISRPYLSETCIKLSLHLALTVSSG